jgi:hypothetical protein
VLAGENKRPTSLDGPLSLLWVLAHENKRTTSLLGLSFIVVSVGWQERTIDEPRRLINVIIVVVGDAGKDK